MRNQEGYSKQLDFMRTGFGISMLVNPEYLAANEIARILRFPSAIKLEPFANGRVELAEIGISLVQDQVFLRKQRLFDG